MKLYFCCCCCCPSYNTTIVVISVVVRTRSESMADFVIYQALRILINGRNTILMDLLFIFVNKLEHGCLLRHVMLYVYERTLLRQYFFVFSAIHLGWCPLFWDNWRKAHNNNKNQALTIQFFFVFFAVFRWTYMVDHTYPHKCLRKSGFWLDVFACAICYICVWYAFIMLLSVWLCMLCASFVAQMQYHRNSYIILKFFKAFPEYFSRFLLILRNCTNYWERNSGKMRIVSFNMDLYRLLNAQAKCPYL